MARAGDVKRAVVVTGDEELNKALADFEVKVQKKLGRRAAKTAAKHIMNRMKLTAPLKTGQLANALKVRAMKRSRTATRLGKFGSSVQLGGGFFIGDTFYGGFLEFGTKPRFHQSGKSVGFVPPNKFDFMRDTLYSSQSETRRIFTGALKEEVRNAGRAG